MCTKCQIDKEAGEFYKEPRKRNGLTAACKQCVADRDKLARLARTPQKRAQQREKRQAYYAENKDKWVERWPGYYAENAEKIRQNSRQWYADNLDRALASQRAWADRNPEKIKSAKRAWRQANPDALRVFGSVRRAREKRAVPPWEIDAIARERTWREKNPGMTLDHIVPIAPPLAVTLGGRPIRSRARKNFVGPLIPLVYGFHTEANWQPLTQSENSRKNHFDWPYAPWHE